jgi:hypothetical protein
MGRKIFRPAMAGLIAALFIGEAAGFGWAAVLEFQPASLERTLFSKKNHTLTIMGSVPEGSQVILKIVSPTREFKLNKAGKGLGVIWLPVGHAAVKNIPGMYVLMSSAKISEILSPQEQQTTGLTTDFREIHQQAEIVYKEKLPKEEAGKEGREYISGLVRILEKRGLYQVREGAVDIHDGIFRAQLLHPADAPLGEYRVFLLAVQNGKARLVAEETFPVRAVGLVGWLSRQASGNSVIYGVLAALIAVGVGVFVGIIFKRGGGH